MADELNFPQVQLILWGDYYTSDATIVPLIEHLFNDLVSGPFMNGLAQYGIHRGTLRTPLIYIDLGKYPAPSQIWENDLQNDLLKWFGHGVPAPAVNQTNLLYFILPPTETTLLYNNGPKDPIGNNVQGWHSETKFNPSSSFDDVIWATVKANDGDRSTPQNFVQGKAAIIGHELVEACNDPLFPDRKELGDPCQNNATVPYRGWQVQTYWSNWDNGCINGDKPISIRKFLTALNIQTGRLSALHTSVINVDYIASRL
jgi:hypothetical protein